METKAYDMKPSLNPKGGLTPLVSAQGGQPGGNSLFADMLGQKISQTIDSDSTPNSSNSSSIRENPQKISTKKLIQNGKNEAETGGTVQRTAENHTSSSTDINKQLVVLAEQTESETTNNTPASETEKSNAEETQILIQFQTVMNLPQQEDAPLNLTGSSGNVLLTVSDDMEPAESAKVSISLLKEGMQQVQEGMGQTAAIPVTGEIALPGDPTQVENAPFPTAPINEPDAILFTQAVKSQEAASLEKMIDGSPIGKTNVEEASGLSIPIYREIPTLSDRNIEQRPLLDDAGFRTEPAVAQQMDEILSLTQTEPVSDSVLPDVRQTSLANNDQWKGTGESKEQAWIASAPQKSDSTVGDSNAMTGQTTPEFAKPEGQPDKILGIRDILTELQLSAQDRQQNQNTVSNNQIGLSERDMLPFRTEIAPLVSLYEASPSIALRSTRIDTQNVIDQILVARQNAKNDFGRIRIMLNPPHLGAVDLDVVVRGEKVEVVMTAENMSVQQALQSRADDIRIALQRQDLKIEGFQVLLQDSGTDQQQTNSDAMYQQDREHPDGFYANEDVLPVSPIISSFAGTKSSSGLVSIFA